MSEDNKTEVSEVNQTWPNPQPNPRYSPPTGYVPANSAPEWKSATSYQADNYNPNPYNANPVPPYQKTPVDLYRLAEKRVKEKMRFYKHLTSYLTVNALLWAIAFIGWLSNGSHNLWTLIWPIWVTVFWGIGLVSDYIKIFGLGESTQQRMIDEELRRLRR
ncbi:MAG: 2TM domain-containing protein [Chloroflexi bacterium]|uniref:2TM domain-containing protein n=1 Tax=Candidatus Chlorohelix allophototropha TaxID=3003348 RepID=A0A8T7M5T3_9CHLR|nr:2TM domain-containing protein [Chloroflexota bacterium]WJW69370.1 2TM domain-containing protein [Chloroflexota bacterium L227-S17]